jgi:hypothetical protein
VAALGRTGRRHCGAAARVVEMIREGGRRRGGGREGNVAREVGGVVEAARGNDGAAASGVGRWGEDARGKSGG